MMIGTTHATRPGPQVTHQQRRIGPGISTPRLRVIGAIAAGAVPANPGHVSVSVWTSPTALLAGFLFVLACGYLAAVYLVGEAARLGDPRKQAYVTCGVQAAAVVAGALAVLAALHGSNPALDARLTGRALPLVILAGVCGLAVLTLLTVGRPTGIRGIAALGVAAVVREWGVAQYPVLLPGTTLTLTNAGAPSDTLVAWPVVVALLIGPSFALLFTLHGRCLLRADEAGTLPAVIPASRTKPPATRSGQPPAGQGPVIRATVLALVVLAASFRRRGRHR